MTVSSESQLAPGPDLAPVLAGLLRREGIGLLARRQRLNGLLRDYAPMAIREIRLLLAAHDAGIPARLEASLDPLAAVPLVAEAGRMVDEFGCAEPHARNAVETWARALAGLRAGAPIALTAVAAPTPARQGAQGDDGEQPGWFARWGGIGIAGLLVLTAIIRWLTS